MQNQTGVVSACVGAFLSEKSAELSPYSIRHLKSSLTPMAAALDDIPLEAVTYADLRGYVDGLYLRYKPGTIRPIVGDIRTFFRWCKKRKMVKRNPAKRLKPPSRRVMEATTPPRAPLEEDVLQVVDYLAGLLSPVVYRDIFGNLCAIPARWWGKLDHLALRDLFALVFLYETGARNGELRELSSRSMNEAVAQPGPAYCVIATGKTNVQTLWFTTATAELWRIWSAVRPAGFEEYALVSLRHWKPAPITERTTLSQALARRCREAGVTPFRTHALRHARAQRGEQSAGLEVTRRLLGHSSLNVTARYARAREEQLSEGVIAAGLSRQLFGSKPHGSHP